MKYKKVYCLDCGKQLNYWACYGDGSKRCTFCAMKKRFSNPKNNVMYGRKHTLESRKKISNTRIINKVAVGDRNPNYINGESLSEYPVEFNDDLRYEIRIRDNFECQNCGMTEEEHYIVQGQALHVHHIDYDKLNLNKINLITLCLWCNLRANKNRSFWKEFFIEKIKKIYEKIISC